MTERKKLRRIGYVSLAVILSLLCAACSPVAKPEGQATRQATPAESPSPETEAIPAGTTTMPSKAQVTPATATPVPPSGEATPWPEVSVPSEAQEIVRQARQDLAKWLEADEEISVVSVEAVEWPDASLGCPQPGMMYAQVITPGYLLFLKARGQQYEYHTSREHAVLCTSLSPRAWPIPQLGIEVTVPAGFRIGVFAEGLLGPRFMVLSPEGVLLVAERGARRVVALPDRDGDGRADEKIVVADNMIAPSSLAFHEGALYVGETTRISRLVLDEDWQAVEREVVVSDLPGRRGHSTRTVIFGSDGQMVVSVGSSCNVCIEDDPRRAAISIYPPQGGEGRVYAQGLRNAVGLAVNPWTGSLWATNNGRDGMGDDVPPETLYVVRDGADYGWPRCHAGDILDPDYGEPGACEGVEEPVVEMQAHSAPLGITFYDGEQFPPEYHQNAYIAFHGSWNRTVPTGYKVIRVPVEGDQVAGPVQDFAVGWLQSDGSAPGRPVGVTVGADGSLYVSDDQAGLIYRISYEEELR